MRIVVKLGTNILTGADGSIDSSRIAGFAKELSDLKNAGNEIIIVTSGAIGSAMGKLGISKRPSTLSEKQALAAVGQPILMNVYENEFAKMNECVAQILLTRQDFDDRTRYLNARNTLLTLLDMKVIPVINENDTVSVEEINFGDNDTLAALVAAKVSADVVILLSDVDGLYDGDPAVSKLVEKVDKITPEIEAYAKGAAAGGKGTGGMITKINAAKIAAAAGVKLIIANGRSLNIITDIFNDKTTRYTLFLPQKCMDARQCWIAFGTKSKGKIFVDEGAKAALVSKGKSLLPKGITKIEGPFDIGDTVSVAGSDGNEFARGLTNYSSALIEKIKGKTTQEAEELLSQSGQEEVIHRNNMAIINA